MQCTYDTMPMYLPTYTVTYSVARLLQCVFLTHARTYLKDDPKLKALGNLSLEAVGLANKTPHTLHQDDTVITALKTVLDHDLHAVGIVDENGKLVGNFSEKDVKVSRDLIQCCF